MSYWLGALAMMLTQRGHHMAHPVTRTILTVTPDPHPWVGGVGVPGAPSPPRCSQHMAGAEWWGGTPASQRTEEAEVSQAGGTRDTGSVTGGTTSGPAAPRSPQHGPGGPVAMAPWLPTKEKYGVGELGLWVLDPVGVFTGLEGHRGWQNGMLRVR